MARAPSLVDYAPERTEQLGNSMDFVEDDQTIRILLEKENRLSQFLSIRPSFQVEIE
jgi:hypothetical protein